MSTFVSGLNKTINQEADKILKKFSKGRINEGEALKRFEALIDKKLSKTTIVVRYSLLKKKAKLSKAPASFINKIKPPSDILKIVLKQNLDRRDEQTVLNVKISDINKIIELKNSENPIDLSLYLLLVSGRRSHELLNAEFSKVKNSKLKVHIKGLSKIKSNPDECDFPILISSRRFIKLVKKMREYEVNKSTFTTLLGRHLKRAMSYKSKPPSLIPADEWTPHMLRGIYANYMFKHHNPKGKKVNTFIRDVLCQYTTDASMSYTQYKLPQKTLKF